MRLIFTFLFALLLYGGASAEDEFEKGAFLGAEGEGALDGAIAFGYALVSRVRSLSIGSETTTVVPGDQIEAGCHDTTTIIGSPELPEEGGNLAEVNLNTVVMGNVLTLNLGCHDQ